MARRSHSSLTPGCPGSRCGQIWVSPTVWHLRWRSISAPQYWSHPRRSPNPSPSPQVPYSKLSFSWLDLTRTVIWWPTMVAAQPCSGSWPSSCYFSYGNADPGGTMLTKSIAVRAAGVSQWHPQPRPHVDPQTQSMNLLTMGGMSCREIPPPGFHLCSSVSH